LGVFVLPGTSFERPECVRFGLGVEPRLFAEALERLSGWVKGK